MTARAYRIARSLRRVRGLKAVLLILTSAVLLNHPAAGRAAESDPEVQVLAVVTALFDGMREKDPELLRSVFQPDAAVGKSSVEEFVSNVLAASAHLDEVTFDETVLIDGDLAMAWTPYNIFVDGEFHHCGVDLFVLKRSDEVWRISSLEDTRRTGNCEEDRRD